MNKQKYEIGKEFYPSKTNDKFIDVNFYYDDGNSWIGCLPIYNEKNGIEFDIETLIKDIDIYHKALEEKNKKETFEKLKNRWKNQKNTETHKVFMSLLKCDWICRTCVTGKINDQPPARIRDIKKFGFTIATKNIYCQNCLKKTYHDILLPFDFGTGHRLDNRKNISQALRKKIIKILGNQHSFWNRKEQNLLVDHKFPSQRWVSEEINNESLSDNEIKEKFQLLCNQTNMLKSRICDECVKTNLRPSFLGIKWFYEGDENYIKYQENPEKGCFGCPWYDIEKWKRELNKFLRIFQK